MDRDRVTEVELATLQGIFASTIEALERAQQEVGQLEAERDAALARVRRLEQRVEDLQRLALDLAVRAGVPTDQVIPAGNGDNDVSGSAEA